MVLFFPSFLERLKTFKTDRNMTSHLSNKRKKFFDTVDIMSVSSPKFAACITGYHSSSQYVSEAL